jgi:hypothetical protein
VGVPDPDWKPCAGGIAGCKFLAAAESTTWFESLPHGGLEYGYRGGDDAAYLVHYDSTLKPVLAIHQPFGCTVVNGASVERDCMEVVDFSAEDRTAVVACGDPLAPTFVASHFYKGWPMAVGADVIAIGSNQSLLILEGTDRETARHTTHAALYYDVLARGHDIIALLLNKNGVDGQVGLWAWNGADGFDLLYAPPAPHLISQVAVEGDTLVWTQYNPVPRPVTDHALYTAAWTTDPSRFVPRKLADLTAVSSDARLSPLNGRVGYSGGPEAVFQVSDGKGWKLPIPEALRYRFAHGMALTDEWVFLPGVRRLGAPKVAGPVRARASLAIISTSFPANATFQPSPPGRRPLGPIDQTHLQTAAPPKHQQGATDPRARGSRASRC